MQTVAYYQPANLLLIAVSLHGTWLGGKGHLPRIRTLSTELSMQSLRTPGDETGKVGVQPENETTDFGDDHIPSLVSIYRTYRGARLLRWLSAAHVAEWVRQLHVDPVVPGSNPEF